MYTLQIWWGKTYIEVYLCVVTQQNSGNFCVKNNESGYNFLCFAEI